VKYSREEKIKRIRRRESAYRDKKESKKLSSLGMTTAILLCSVVGLVVEMSDRPSRIIIAGNGYGAMLVNSGAGGYILAGVIAFMAGVIITVLCVRHRRH
jgi:hypothetical protein